MWLLSGALLKRKAALPHALAVLPVRGDAPEMEENVRVLLEEYPPVGRGLPVLLADCGLTPEAAARAELLSQGDHRITVVTPQEITNFFT
jgi:hypothetical protein